MVDSRPRFAVSMAGLLPMALGAVSLLGWALDNATLKSVFPALVTIKANTTIGLLAAGGGMALLAGREIPLALRFVVVVLAALNVALGSLTLSEYFFGWNLGLDELLFREFHPSVDTSQPGRMAPSTAFSFVLAGVGLLIATPRVVAKGRIPLLAALGASLLLIGTIAFLGQVSNALLYFRIWNYFGMALQTALSVASLGLGFIFLARIEGGLKWSLNRSITAGFIFAVVILLSASGMSWNYTHQLQEGALGVARAHEILKEIEEIRADKAILESAQRGYLILGDEALLAPRPQLKEEVRQDMLELRRLTLGDVAQQHWLNELDSLMEQRTAFTERLLAVRREQGFPAAQQLMATRVGLALSTEIARVLAAMHAEELTQLEARQKKADEASAVTFLLLPVAVFLSLTLISIALFFLNSGVGEQTQTEEKLRVSLKEIGELQSALDEHAIVAVTDPAGRITYVNDKFCAISGYARAELLGQDHRLINSGHHPKAFIRDLWQTILSGRVWHGEICNRAKNGALYWVDTTIVPFFDARGQTRQYIAIRTDITARKRTEDALQESERRFRNMADAIPQLAWMANPDGHIFWYNQRWFEYTGTTPAQMEGWGWQSVHDPAVLPDVMKRWKLSLAEAKPFEMEFPLRARDGSFGWFLTRIIPFKDEAGRVVRWFGTNTDLSQKRAAEEEIQRLNVGLEQRVAERTAELQSANKELEAFSYSISHDLRTPLRAVDGFSQAVMEDYGPQLPTEAQRYLRTIRDGAQRMGRLIDDLLAFSRLSRSTLNQRPVEMDEMVDRVLEELAGEMASRKIEVRRSKLPAGRGDAAMVKQVWTNLLANAVKYTRQREEAVIEIGCELGRPAVYFVRDNGAGFDMRYADKLFGVFQRLHRADQFEGTGVGLAIVQRIVTRHGGHVWAEAEYDRGATFRFTLQPGKETRV